MLIISFYSSLLLHYFLPLFVTPYFRSLLLLFVLMRIMYSWGMLCLGGAVPPGVPIMICAYTIMFSQLVIFYFALIFFFVSMDPCK